MMALLNSTNVTSALLDSFLKFSQNNNRFSTAIYNLDHFNHNNYNIDNSSSSNINDNYIEDNFNFGNNLNSFNFSNNTDLNVEESKSFGIEDLVDLSFMDETMPKSASASSVSSSSSPSLTMTNELGLSILENKFSQLNSNENFLSMVNNANENYYQISINNTKTRTNANYINDNNNNNYGYTERLVTRRGENYYNQFGWSSLEKVQFKLPYLIMLNQNKIADFESEESAKIIKTNTNTTIQNMENDQQRLNFKNSNNKNNANSKSRKRMECAFCKNLPDQQDNYKTHWLKDNEKRVICPVLRRYCCPICHNGGGDDAHTMRFCPKNRSVMAKEFFNSIARLNLKNSKQKPMPIINSKYRNNLLDNPSINPFLNGNQYI